MPGSLTLLILFALSIVYAWTPVGPADIRRASPGDVVEVLFLEAPLLEWKFGPVLGYLNLYHNALGFRNLNTSNEWSVEYDAIPSIFSALGPKFINTSQGVELSWEAKGAAILYNIINETYWTKEIRRIAHISGEIHNNFIDQVQTINKTKPFYNLFNVMTEWGPEGKLYLNSYTCADFVFDGAELLYKLGAEFEVKTLRKNDINFYVEEPPKEVKYEESKKEIVSYFELAALRLAEMDIENFLKTLSELFVGTVYIHHDEKYYKLNLHWPNFNWKFTAQPLPPHKTTTFEQVKRNIEINK